MKKIITQQICCMIDTQDATAYNTKHFLLIENNADFDVKNYTITEKKKLRSFRIRYNEF